MADRPRCCQKGARGVAGSNPVGPTCEIEQLRPDTGAVNFWGELGLAVGESGMRMDGLRFYAMLTCRG